MMIGMPFRILAQILSLLHAPSLGIFLMHIRLKMQKATVAH